MKPFWYDLFAEAAQNQMAGQSSRHRHPFPGPLTHIHSLLRRAHITWEGHVARMPDERLPKSFSMGEGKRSHRGQKKHFKDTLKASIKSFNTDPEAWEELAQNHSNWYSLTNKGVASFKQRKTTRAAKKCVLRKSRAASTSSATTPHMPNERNTFPSTDWAVKSPPDSLRYLMFLLY